MQRSERKILLAAINSRFTHSNLALRYLREYAGGLGFSLPLREFTVQQNPASIAAALLREDPDGLALSAYIWNVQAVRTVIELVRAKAPWCVIILGGPEAGYDPAPWLDAGMADFIVTGRGEQGFRELLERNMTWDEPVVSCANPHFSRIPMPYVESDFRELAHRYVYYESSRGCPFRCSYCLSSRSDQELEMKDTTVVLEEIDFIVSHRPHTVKFVDRSFNASGEHAREIWWHCITRHGGTGTQFHFELHPSLMEDDDFRVLERAPKGLFRFEIGLQSANALTLREIGRVQEWEGASRTVARLAAMGKFHIHADLIAGLPCEDMASMERSFNGAYGLGADYLQLGFLKVLPGTAIASRAEEYGMEHDPRPPYRIMKTRWLSSEELERLDRMAHLVNSLHNTGNFPITLKELARAHDSPYALFHRMSLHGERKDIELPDRDWSRGARFIVSYAEAALKDEVRFLMDCLRWDWCGARAPRLYPPFLRREGEDRFRKEMLRRFKGQRGEKKEFVFIPETERFRKEYCGGDEMAVFPMHS